MNNKQYHTEQYKRKQSEKNDRIFGPISDHKKICKICENEFIFTGRHKTKAFKKAVFCSISCSNNRSDWWLENATYYRTICFQKKDKKCIICGFDKIVVVHHLDRNHKNNNIENLVPLCPNHHSMIHTIEYKDEVLELINNIIVE